MKSDGVDYDIIGLSYYPIWHKDIRTLETTINTLEEEFNDKDIMIVETGAAYSWLPSDKDYTPSYEASEEGQKKFIDDLITMLNKHDSVTGLFWWWMDYNPYPWDTTQMNDWWYAPLYNGNTGKPLAALSSLKSFLNGSENAILGIEAEKPADNSWTTLTGVKVSKPTRSGIYIHNGKKVVVR